jgi:Sulfotransferase family
MGRSHVEQFNMVAASGSERGVSGAGKLLDPVFVLCMGRSGSTLLRLVLDTHPDLACPPETNIPGLCAQLAVVWSLIEGAPLSLQRGDAPPAIPDAAIAGIRQTMDLMTVPYLARRGKRLYCDKSLGTAAYAELLTRIYPGARFICLFRHPMDMISSGLEACPWGLNGYGFDPYIAGSPGNAVMALARYWNDQASAITAAEDKYPERCHRVRYEDMARDPEQVAAAIFRFLGVGQVPGIAQAVFASDHERFGPADHKIWHTSAISLDSVGRGDSVPVGLIPPPVLESINEMLDRLGYTAVDETWGTASTPTSLFSSGDGGLRHGAPPPQTAALADRLAAGLDRLDDTQAARWQERLAEAFTVVVRQPNRADPVWWQVSPDARVLLASDHQTLAASDGCGDNDDGDAEADWSIVGTGRAWQDVLNGNLNLSAALRRNELRYCDYGENDVFVTEARISLLASLLGLPSLADSPAFAGEQIPALAD